MKSKIVLIALTVVLTAGAMMIEHYGSLSTWQLLLVYLIPYLIIGHDTLHEAWEGIAGGEMMNEHFLMSVATVGALAIGFLPGAETEFAEAVFVMLFFQIGELFEGYAEGQSRQSIAHLMDLRADVAHLVDGGGERDVKPEEVAVGGLVSVKPGERIPLDGIVDEGTSTLDTSSLTGEAMPRRVEPGDEVVSGCVNLSGRLVLRVTRCYGESTAARIIDLVEHAADHKSKSESFIARFARVYTPIVVFAALAIAIIPPCLSLAFYHQPFSASIATWLHRALIFLVVSCPCALVISVPLTFFGGIGGASRKGILIKGSNYFDQLAKLQTVVFDKTGTLTEGRFAVVAVHPDNCDEHQLLHLAAHVEHYSTHPIGEALRQAFPAEATDGCRVSDVKEVAGHGVWAKVDGHTVCVGNEKMMATAGAVCNACPHEHDGTVIHVGIDGVYAGHIVISDVVKDDAAEAIRRLHQQGVSHTVMLTGDRQEMADKVARQLGLDEWHAGLLPTDKVERVEHLLHQQEGRHATLAFVGDGINDAPVLARADVGIAMGALGSDAAIEAADVVLMDDQPSKVAVAVDMARRTIAIARQNVVLAIGVKVAVLLLASVGMATMWMAVFADVGVTVLAVLNAMRAAVMSDSFTKKQGV
ncbi:MAG: cadmium-translocating P-type ATPase [Prevotella sp.]|nr:cadmium-translocating P-type ATPase [Prevotella sp.]